MYERAKQFTLTTPLLRKSIGWVIFVAGVIALITPFTPGALILLLIGLELIGLEFVFARKLREKIDSNNPTKK